MGGPVGAGDRPDAPPGSGRAARVAGAVVAGAAITSAADALLGRLPAQAVPGWTRTNFRGRRVTLAGGVAAAGGATIAATACAPRGLRLAAGVVGTGAALAGAYDDLVAPRLEQAGDKGWRGHLRAVRARRPSGGVVKVAVIGACALTAGRLTSATWTSALPAGALIAGTANLVNLFDLRPGRAGKVAGLLALGQVAGPAGTLAGAVGGSVAAALPGDLGERRMLGDVGANTLGALLGLRLGANGPVARWAALGAVVALTAASERVSFTQVIAAHAPLRTFDEWGRRTVVEAPPL